MPSYLLDSNILILHFRKRPDVTAMLERWGAEGDLYISVAVRTEILAGMRPHEEATTMGLLESMISIPADNAIADQAGRWMYAYARQGLQLAFPDAIIAATAAVHNLTLATTNSRHFPMPELDIYTVPVTG